MKGADIITGGEYAYKRGSRSWNYADKVTVIGTGLKGGFWQWASQDDFRIVNVRNKFGLPSTAKVLVVDENANVLITGVQNGIGPNYSLVNSRFIVSTWADEVVRREEARSEQERVQERIAQQRRDREAADAARAEARAVWDGEFPAVRDAFAAIGLTIAQGVDGISLSPEKAKAVAEFIRANGIKEVAA